MYSHCLVRWLIEAFVHRLRSTLLCPFMSRIVPARKRTSPTKIRKGRSSMLQLYSATFNAFSENTYIIYNEDKACWIVDPGMYDPSELQAFDAFIAEQGLKPQGIIN